jgi:hypothetical protein
MACISAETNQCSELKRNPWNDPKLTVGEAMDIRIQEARYVVEQLCIQKAKLEAMDWLKLPYHDTRKLINCEGYPF